MGDTVGQPLSGDPDVVGKKAHHYKRIGEDIASASAALYAISDESKMRAKSLDAVRDKAKTAADDISKAQSRYETASQALITYAGALRTAQADAATANKHWQHYTERRTALQQQIDGGTLDDETKKKYQKEIDDEIAPKITEYEKHWHTASSDKESAAVTAMNTISDLISENSGGLNDPKHHWYDAVVKVAKVALDVVTKICDVASILSVFLAWVPVLGEALLILTAIGGAIELVKGIIEIAQGHGLEGAFDMALGALSMLGAAGAMSKIAKEAKAANSMYKTERGAQKAVGVGKAAYRTAAKQLKTVYSAEGKKALNEALRDLANGEGIAVIKANLRSFGAAGDIIDGLIDAGAGGKKILDALKKGEEAENEAVNVTTHAAHGAHAAHEAGDASTKAEKVRKAAEKGKDGVEGAHDMYDGGKDSKDATHEGHQSHSEVKKKQKDDLLSPVLDG